MTIMKVSELTNQADNRQITARSIAAEYENLRIPVGSGWFDAMNNAGVPGATAASLSSAMQARMTDVALAYTEAASNLRYLLELFADARSEINKARSNTEDFIID